MLIHEEARLRWKFCFRCRLPLQISASVHPLGETGEAICDICCQCPPDQGPGDEECAEIAAEEKRAEEIEELEEELAEVEGELEDLEERRDDIEWRLRELDY